MTTMDPNGEFRFHGDKNFIYTKTDVKWIVKTLTSVADYPTPTPNLIVVNTYVKPSNLVWYLYQFFEKTFDINISIDHFAEDLIEKGNRWALFEKLRDDLVYQYPSIKYGTDTTNQAMLYIYHNLLKEHNTSTSAAATVRRRALYCNDTYLNIEYSDFYNKEILASKLSSIPNFNETRFEEMYKILVARNTRFFTRYQSFIDKLSSPDSNFNVLELAYIGILAEQHFNKPIEWDNEPFRKMILKHKLHSIREQAVLNGPA